MYNTNMYSLSTSNSVGQGEIQQAKQKMNSSQTYSSNMSSSNGIEQYEKQKIQQYMNSAQSYNPSSNSLNSAIEAKKIEDARKRMNPYSGGMM